MSAPAFAWAMNRARELKLPTSNRMLLIALADRANGECFCYPSQETLAGDTGLSSRQVRDLAPALERVGLIRIEKRGRLLYYHINRPNGMHQEQTNKSRNPVPLSETTTPEPASAIIPEPSSAIPPQTPEPASGNGAVNTGTRTPQYRNSATILPEPSSDKPYLREPRETKKEPSRSPPTGAGGRRADGTNPRALGTNPRATEDNPRKTGTNPRSSRNTFHDKARELDRQIAAAGLTIDASPGEVVEFNQFLGQRRAIAHG